MTRRIVFSAMLLGTQALGAMPLQPAVQAQPPKRLWVLREPDQIVAYDVITLAATHAVRVPHRLLEHPQYLSINSRGQLMFFPPHGAQWTRGEMASA